MTRATTRQKILSAAIESFAQNGYAGTTASQICKRANANIAAVNYHFGSKDALFEQAIAEAFSIAERTYPLEDESCETPEAQLRYFMSSVIRRVFDDGPAGRIDQIVCHELNRPSGPNPLVLQEIQKRQGQRVRKILGKLLDTRSEKLLNQAHANIAALCFFVKVAKPLQKRIFPEPPTPSQLDHYIHGQIEFALAGLAALKNSFSNKK
ncbi:TetR/AcrR family transcriptional regulator [Pelagicoccus mobilis]|uniref:CerR family C-terminal domain-containing protein n=1 Tax=Pelagicoccus mobilis TaxID=415221 RepID=A0A934S4G1_9BACT|nr:TetR/AcrR family transcriptional regulator [Pelagicoccus mobilis]MBK1878838.1 CerR family C-terminal domain-containing protein [Pelagicoccus mobilis]